MNNGIARVWVIGEISWQDDTARVLVARTKTMARQRAERLLAYDEYQFARGRDDLEKSQSRDARRADWSLNRYCEWVADLAGCTLSVPARAYLELRTGIWLTGPHGERIHITKPSQKARRERLKIERESEGFMTAMCNAMVGRLRNHRSGTQ